MSSDPGFYLLLLTDGSVVVGTKPGRDRVSWQVFGGRRGFGCASDDEIVMQRPIRLPSDMETKMHDIYRNLSESLSDD